MRRLLAVTIVVLAGCSYASRTDLPPIGNSPSGGGRVLDVRSGSFVAVMLGIGVLLGVSQANADGDALQVDQTPPMAEGRRVVEQDCTRPLVDTTANLRCAGRSAKP
jgi:hypothetical protein